MKRSAPIKRYTPIRRVSTKRARQLRQYSTARKAFLVAHPYCQVWLKEHGFTESEALAGKGSVSLVRIDVGVTTRALVVVPIAEEVHHVRKRRGAALLDETHWLAVSVEMHNKIERNKSWARARGYLARF